MLKYKCMHNIISSISQSRTSLDGICGCRACISRPFLYLYLQLQLERMEQRLERKVVMAKETRKLERLQYQKMLQRVMRNQACIAVIILFTLIRIQYIGKVNQSQFGAANAFQ